MKKAAILALLEEKSIPLVAKRCGIHERTLRRWLAEEACFRAEYDGDGEPPTRPESLGFRRSRAAAWKRSRNCSTRRSSRRSGLGAARTLVEVGIHEHDAETIMRKLDEIEAAQRGRNL